VSVIPKSKALCGGCRDDYYNGCGAKECWSYKSARVVKRWKQGWWTPTDQPGALEEVRTLDCHSEPGKNAFLKVLPSCAVDPVRLPKGGAA
jgi:hypothetical protein